MTKNKSKPIALFAAGLLWANLAQAQESVNASGGNATGTGTGGSVDYSIGQVFYTTNTGSSGSVEPGIQHAYEIFTVGVKETVIDISLIVFPNPTVDNLTLQISDYSKEKLTYQLYDMQGKLLNNEQIVSQYTQINTASLAATTYFVYVVNQQNQKVKSFKVIKN